MKHLECVTHKCVGMYEDMPLELGTHLHSPNETMYVAGLNAIATGKFTASECPCNTNKKDSSPPSYVGSDYYCESGLHTMNYHRCIVVAHW